jgi:hypothetical protein
MGRRSRVGERVVLGCLFTPGTLFLGIALLADGDARHGNALLFLIGMFFLVVAGGLMILQAVLPKPPESREAPPPNDRTPAG